MPRTTAQHITKQIRALPKRLWPITHLTILLTILVVALCAGASALVTQHISDKPVPKTSSNPTSNSDGSLLCVYGQPDCPMPSNTSTPTQATPTQATAPQSTTSTKTNDSAVATAPQYSAQYLACIYGDSGKIALGGLYGQTSKWLTSQVVSVANMANSHSITAQQGVDELNAYISSANVQNTGSYQSYLKGRQDNGCSVDVQMPISIPFCDLSGSLSACIDNIRINDNAWGNLLNEL